MRSTRDFEVISASGTFDLTRPAIAQISSTAMFGRVALVMLAIALASMPAAANIRKIPLVVCNIGDSITAGGSVAISPVARLRGDLAQEQFEIIAINRGVSGTATTDWLPGGKLLAAMKAECAERGARIVLVTLGTNDANVRHLTSRADYRRNLEAITQDLTAYGFDAVLNYPPAVLSTHDWFNPTSLSRIAGYAEEIDSLADDVHVFAGDKTAFSYFIEHPEALGADAVHPNQAGSDALALAWARALSPVAKHVLADECRSLQFLSERMPNQPNMH